MIRRSPQSYRPRFSGFVRPLLGILLAAFPIDAAPPAYVPSTAFHIPSETTSEESGSFSLSESHELKEGRKTIIASTGRMAMNFVVRYDDALWAENHEVHDNADFQMKDFEKKTPDGALVLRLDSAGLHHTVHELFGRKHQRVMLATAENPRPEFAVPAEGYAPRADYGFAFGDACVWLDGYPIPILPPSGIMQVAVHEGINVEVHSICPQLLVKKTHPLPNSNSHQ
ncbi:hypothetical protein ACXR0O_04510 [Verrucomicrobiota bacterium sgz303538]